MTRSRPAEGALTRPAGKEWTDAIDRQAHQGLRAKPEGPAAHRAGKGASQQAGEPPQARGAAAALREAAVAPAPALTKRPEGCHGPARSIADPALPGAVTTCDRRH